MSTKRINCSSVIIFLIISTLFILLTNGNENQEETSTVSQDDLEQIEDLSYLDIHSISHVKARAWRKKRTQLSYGEEIRHRYVYNEFLNKSLQEVDDGTYLKRKIAEIRLNELAELVHDVRNLSSLFQEKSKRKEIRRKLISRRKEKEWEELKIALQLQYQINESIIIYNEYKNIWTFCACVQNWYHSSSRSLSSILKNAPSELRVCCAHSIIEAPKIARKPVVLLDYIPLHYTAQMVQEQFTSVDIDRAPFLSSSRQVSATKFNYFDGKGSNRQKLRYADDTEVIDLFADEKYYVPHCLENEYLSSYCFVACCSSINIHRPMCTGSAMSCSTPASLSY